MKSDNKQPIWFDNTTSDSRKYQHPVASNDPFDDDDEAQQKRREERRRRKKEKRREQLSPVEEGDPDLLLQDAKKPKRRKKKKSRSDLWYDESYDDELDEVIEGDHDKQGRPKNDDNGYDEWDL